MHKARLEKVSGQMILSGVQSKIPIQPIYF